MKCPRKSLPVQPDDNFGHSPEEKSGQAILPLKKK